MKTPTNIAIFAHFDKHNLIDDYVIIYLQNLKKFCDKIIFVSDCDLPQKEQDKIKHLTAEIIAQRHEEYDFGSYKRGFNLFKEKYPQDFLNTNLLIFANDSCYCISGFDKVFEKIDQMPEIDGFGLTDNTEKNYHLQSYFLVFRKTIFLEKFFANFWQNIKKLENKRDIIYQYEIGLSELINQNNKSLKAIFGREFLQNYVLQNKFFLEDKIAKIIGFYNKVFKPRKTINDLLKNGDGYTYHDHFYILIQNGCPLVKCRLIGGNFYKRKRPNILTYFWQKILKSETSFDGNIIVNHAKRVFRKVKSPENLPLHIFKKYKSKLLIWLILIGFLIKFLF